MTAPWAEPDGDAVYNGSLIATTVPVAWPCLLERPDGETAPILSWLVTVDERVRALIQPDGLPAMVVAVERHRVIPITPANSDTIRIVEALDKIAASLFQLQATLDDWDELGDSALRITMLPETS